MYKMHFFYEYSSVQEVCKQTNQTKSLKIVQSLEQRSLITTLNVKENMFAFYFK